MSRINKIDKKKTLDVVQTHCCIEQSNESAFLIRQEIRGTIDTAHVYIIDTHTRLDCVNSTKKKKKKNERDHFYRTFSLTCFFVVVVAFSHTHTHARVCISNFAYKSAHDSLLLSTCILSISFFFVFVIYARDVVREKRTAYCVYDACILHVYIKQYRRCCVCTEIRRFWA